MQTVEPKARPLKASIWTRLHYLWSSFWAVLATVLCATGYLISQLLRPTTNVFSWWASTWGRLMFFFSGVRLVLEDRNGSLGQGPCVIMANHQNGLDIPAVAAALPVAFGFVAKAELERMPFLGHALKHSPSVFVDQSDPRRSLASIKTAGEHIRGGSSVLIFPEGQRSYTGHLHAFRKGGFVLAVEAGVPIVPVTIVDAASVFDESRWLSRPGTVRIVAHPAMSLADRTRRDIPELMRLARESIARDLPPEWRNPPEDSPVLGA
ncbi:MAG: 1-acyl-sn-glycerol-3-phosphate acyltransferase [Rhodothermales bacterium]|nr:1-acyl-sn-glycerol-3-phosphate acyltransferase [Rhodothermales bacterium]MBO6779590.1 1-acyl-sn-glycerol-3-phosphate acyltransferase [Rhodothermales bacterium]